MVAGLKASEKAKEAGRIVAKTRRQLSIMTDRELFDLYETVIVVQQDLEKALVQWVRTHPEDAESFTKRGLLSLRLQIARTAKDIEAKLGHAIKRKLGMSGLNAKNMAAILGAEQTNDLSLLFDGRAMDLGAYLEMTRPASLKVNEFAKASSRYSSQVALDIQAKLKQSALLGESFFDATKRLAVALGGKAETATLGQVTNLFADKAFRRAETLVRTEFIGAYNRQARAQFEQLAKDDPANKWQLRWDATDSKRTCPQCAQMDGKLISPGKNYKAPKGTVLAPGKKGVTAPPLHPNCRCSAYPVLAHWEIDEGVTDGDSE